MTVWHTSDLHIGHRRVAEDRWYFTHPGMPLPDDYIGWHDNMIAENWDVTIRPGDKVYVQGDLSLQGKNAIENALLWIAERRRNTGPENIIFIPGNHDGCHTGIERSEGFKWFKRYMEFFDMVVPYARIRVNGEVTHLSHFPYIGGGDHTFEERYTQWRLPDMGDWLLHGHTHSPLKVQCRWRRKNLDVCTSSQAVCTVPDHRDKMIHIGVDAWNYTPVSHDEIATIMEAHREVDEPPSQEVLPTEP